MIIRSQNKAVLVNFKEVDTICVVKYAYERREDFSITYYCGNKGTRGTLASYSTEEKALKALDMICEHYQNCKMCKCGLRQVAETEFIFQMPRDSEI